MAVLVAVYWMAAFVVPFAIVSGTEVPCRHILGGAGALLAHTALPWRMVNAEQALGSATLSDWCVHLDMRRSRPSSVTIGADLRRNGVRGYDRMFSDLSYP